MSCDVSRSILISFTLKKINKMKNLVKKFWRLDREVKGYLFLGLGIVGLFAYSLTLVITGYQEDNLCRGILAALLSSLWAGIYIMSGSFFKSDEKLSAKYFLGGLMVIGLIMFGIAIIGNVMEILNWNMPTYDFSWLLYVFAGYLGITLLAFIGGTFRNA